MSQIALRTSQPVPVSRLMNPARVWLDLWRHRDLIRQFTVREIAQKYRGTQLGLLWAVLQPLMTLAVFTFIFNAVFEVTWPEGDATRAAYVVTVFTGMMVFALFSETVSNAPVIVLSRPNLVTKAVFPIEVLVCASVGSAIFVAMVSTGLILIATLLLLGTVHWTAVLIPIVLLPVVLLSLGLGWFLASLGVFLRDIRPVVTVLVTQVLYFMTPIFYPIERVPEAFRSYLYWNPMTQIVQDARRVLIWGRQPDWQGWAIVLLLSLVVMQLGYAWFMKSRRGFADVL